MISNRARRPRKRCSRMAPSARARNAPAGSAVRPIETAGRRERLPGKREGAGGPGHDIVSIAEHSPEVSEETVPRLSRARRRAIVMFDRDHREQVPGRRHRVPAEILHPRQVPTHAPEVCEDVSGRLNRRMEPQRRIATSDRGGFDRSCPSGADGRAAGSRAPPTRPVRRSIRPHRKNRRPESTDRRLASLGD